MPNIVIYKKSKPTKTVWVTATGKRCPIKKMTNDHLINTIRYIRKVSKVYHSYMLCSMYQFQSTLQGEEAIYEIERQINYWEDFDIHETAEALFNCGVYSYMLEELDRRNLQIEKP